MNNILDKLSEKIDRGEEISPLLFIGKNLNLLNSKVEDLAKSLLKKYGIPTAYFYVLKDSGENLKVKDVKDFVEFSNTKSPYKFQIFFIENISKLTTASSNSLLKLLEEPGKENLIFLSNAYEANILETVLSRVVVISTPNVYKDKDNEMFSFGEFIKNYIERKNNDLISYFFKGKLEKEEYLKFLEDLFLYCKNNFCFIDYLEELNDDINGIKQNNLNARFIVDKWLVYMR